MLFIPVVFGLIFFLTLALKLLGGKIAWWVVIIFGALFILPILILMIMAALARFKHSKKQ